MRSELQNRLKENYTIIPNELINDVTISPDARFLYTLLASKPDGWRFYNSNLTKLIGRSEDTLRKYMRELETSGWITIVSQPQQSRVDGKFPPNKYILHPTKNYVSEKPRDLKTQRPKNPETYKEVNLIRSINNKKNNITLSEVKTTHKEINNSTLKNKTNKYLPYARKLSKTIQRAKNIKHTLTQLKSWCTDFRQLVEQDNISIDRIKIILKWYDTAIGGEYIPVVQSGNSFRHKFINLEDAMKRNLKSKFTNNRTNVYHGNDYARFTRAEQEQNKTGRN